MKKIYLLMMLLSTMLLSITTGCTNSGKKTAEENANGVVVKISVVTWDRVNLYAWLDDGRRPLGNWPGESLEKGEDGMYEYHFAPEIKRVNVVVNNFTEEGGSQTQDVTGLTGTVTLHVDESGHCTVEKME